MRKDRPPRRTVSIRGPVFDRLMHLVDSDRGKFKSGSALVESLLTAYLDQVGAPEAVPVHVPGPTGRRPNTAKAADVTTQDEIRRAVEEHFTF